MGRYWSKTQKVGVPVRQLAKAAAGDMRKTAAIAFITLIPACHSAVSPKSKLSIDNAENCADQYPASKAVYISIRDTARGEIYNSMCSSTVLGSGQFAVLAKHCLYLDLASSSSRRARLPKVLADQYASSKLVVQHWIGNRKADYSLAASSGRLGLLLFKQPLPVRRGATAVQWTDANQECRLVGFSPKKLIERRYPSFRSSGDVALSKMDEYIKTRRRIFVEASQEAQCGRGALLGELNRNSVFSGTSQGGNSAEAGDSGGSCYVASSDGSMRLAGLIEGGRNVKTYASNFEAAVDSNVITLFKPQVHGQLRRLIGEAEAILKSGLPSSGTVYNSKDSHLTFDLTATNPVIGQTGS